MEPSTTGWAESEQKDDQAVEMKRPMTDFDGVDGVMWVVSFRPRLLAGWAKVYTVYSRDGSAPAPRAVFLMTSPHHSGAPEA
jgi:hypothetical protein